MTGTPRLAIFNDFPEERWPSMDLCAEMLLRGLERDGRVAAALACPPFRRRLARVPVIGSRGAARNADRLLNRMRDYPRHARRAAKQFDLFHVCDHSYAQLVTELPPGRTGVLCHDLDTFRCLLDPAAEPRPRWFRGMMRRVLRGLQSAAVVFYTTRAVREQIERHGLVDASRLVRAPLGTSPEFRPEGPRADVGGPFVLHVGSCIPRKRIDVLLDVFAILRERHPELRLVQVGGTWTPPQVAQMDRLGIGGAITQVRGVDRETVASYYRAAAAVLVTSDAEGFGLPVIEALACGAPVIASDIPVLREVGGDAIGYARVGDVAGWATLAGALMDGPAVPRVAARLARAGTFSWAEHARLIADAYVRLAGGRAEGSP